MKLDLSKYKKISSDSKSTTLKHPDGHSITVAHAALSPKMRGELARIPLHLAAGTPDDVIEPTQNASTEPTVQSMEAPMQSTEGTPDTQAQQTTQTPPNTSAADVAPATPNDQTLDRKRELYNMRIQSKYPRGRAPNPQAGAAQFTNGQAPQNFDPDAWNQAEGDFTQEEARKLQNNQSQIADTAAQNAARGRAGLPPLPMPPNLQPDVPPPPPGVAQATGAPTPSGSGDMFGNEATSQAYMQGLGEQKAGIMGEAQAQGALGAAQSQVLGNQIETQKTLANNYQSHFNDLDQERQSFSHDVQNNMIDPSHYLNSMGTAQKVKTGIGLILGGIGGGLTHQANPALALLQNQIDRDIKSQQDNLGARENLLSANLRQFGNLRDATDMTRVMQSDIVSNQLKQAAANSMDPLAKARALQAAGQLDTTAAPVLGQMAMRKTLLQGFSQGQVAPEQVIRAIVPPQQQEAATKELAAAQSMVRARDNLLGTFDKLTETNTIGNRIMSPLQTPKMVAALRDPLIAGLSKETAGRFTEQDAGMLSSLFPMAGDTSDVIALKRRQMDKLISEKMNFPGLSMWGIHPEQMGRYGMNAQPKIQMRKLQ